MYVSDFRPNSKEMAVATLVCVAVLVAVFCVGYVIGLRNASSTDAGSVPDHGTGIDHVREQYQHIEVNQREITDGIGSAKEGAARIEGGIQQAAAATERAEAAVTDAGRLIDESQQILGRIRNRGKTGAASH